MQKIRDYVENFKKHNKMNEHYTMRGSELFATIDEVKTDAFRTVVSLFEFGYAKGYRAAMSEMKKKGGARV